MSNPFEELQKQLTRIEGLLTMVLKQQPTTAPMAPELPIGIERATKLLNLSSSRIYQNKAIPRHKRNGKLHFFESEILAYIRDKPAGDQAPISTASGQRKRRAKKAPGKEGRTLLS